MNKLGRKKAVAYALVLAAGLIGLVIDRLGQTPANATGGPATEAVSGGNTPTGPVGSWSARSARAEARGSQATGCPAPLGPAIAKIFDTPSNSREQAGNPVTPLRNAFEMASPMRAFYEGAGPNQQAREEERIQNERERLRQEVAGFQAAHKLKGTTLQEDLSWALVDNSIVRLGDKIDGFELRSIERYRAVFVKNDVTVTLSLPLP